MYCIDITRSYIPDGCALGHRAHRAATPTPGKGDGKAGQVPVMSGPRGTSGGMAEGMCGFRDAGYVRPDGAPFGCLLHGSDVEMDGFFAKGTGDKSPGAQLRKSCLACQESFEIM